MNRIISIVVEPNSFRKKLISWASDLDVFCFLDSNDYSKKLDRLTSYAKYNKYDYLAAVGVSKELKVPAANPRNINVFNELKRFNHLEDDWIFGFLSYDAKNHTEDLVSENLDKTNMPLAHFFKPMYVFAVIKDRLEVWEEDDTKRSEYGITIEFSGIQLSPGEFRSRGKLSRRVAGIRSSMSKSDYIEAVNGLKQEIQKGEIYEVNFCQEFYSDELIIDPLEMYIDLCRTSPAPFSAFYKLLDKYVICGSPERFISKLGSKIISQPIKGTSKRAKDSEQDLQLAAMLTANPKERAENIMIVDMVRNDLSRSSIVGSVSVEELCKLYSFTDWHQMISTVVGIHDSAVHPVDIIKNAYPMASMTGTPKIRAMELIEQYEVSRRGIYSGTIGYFDPSGNFDFNVVIRSLIYASEEGNLSFMTGGAITSLSEAESEYSECLLKAKGIMRLLNLKL